MQSKFGSDQEKERRRRDARVSIATGSRGQWPAADNVKLLVSLLKSEAVLLQQSLLRRYVDLRDSLQHWRHTRGRYECEIATVLRGFFDCVLLQVSYGKMSRYRNYARVIQVSPKIAIMFSGDHADFQFLKSIVDYKM